MLKEYKVWDRTTRVFHWVNFLCVLGLSVLGAMVLYGSSFGATVDGRNYLKVLHTWVGYVFTINLAWRLVWGFIGGPYARWCAVLPFGAGYAGRLSGELKDIGAGRKANYLGHSPLGRIAATVLLLFLLVEAGTGLVLAGTDVYMPPFGRAIAARVVADGLDPSQVRPNAPETVDPVAYKEMRTMRGPYASTHTNMFFILLGLIVVHILAVVMTDVKRGGNIISAMFSGRKVLGEPPADPH